MIDVVEGDAIRRLLEKAARTPELYRRLIIVSPFIDEYGWELVTRSLRTRRGRVPRVTLVLRPDAVEKVSRWAGSRQDQFDIVVRQRLHAKVYALLGFRSAAHEAIITSSNLTAAGIEQNLELGLTIRGATDRLASMVERVGHFVTKG